MEENTENQENQENLTKHQRRELKREMREQERKEEMSKIQKNKRSKMIMKVGIVAVVLVAIGFFFMQNNPATADITDPRGPSSMKITPTFYDFGDVSVAKGIANTTMNILNEGKGDLVIKYMESSCACTAASIIFNGVESPRFGMHGNSVSWSQTIGPNETAQLKIYYDPTVHRDLRGPVTRTIKIYSNDPVNPKKEVRIDVNQVA